MHPTGSGPLPATGPRRRPAWPALALALLAFAAYANSFPGAFLSDDFPIIVDNPAVTEGRWRELLAADYWGPGVNSRLHRPLTLLSYAANRALFGPGPLSFHLTNVALHGAVTLALHAVLRALGVGAGVAWAAAALFAVHPVHTETVNIVTGRSELLAAFFVLLGLLAAYRRGRPRHLGVAAALAAALLSKESAAAFPLLLVLGDAFAERDWHALARRRWRLWALAAAVPSAWLALRRFALPSAGLPFTTTILPLDNPLVDLSLPWRLATALKVQALYLAKLAFPLRLHAAYVERMLGPPAGALDARWLGLLLVPAALAALAVAGWRRRDPFALGLAWYAAAFLVTGNLIVVTPYLMAERFAYAPSAGFCLAAAGLAAAGAARIPGGRGRAAAAAACALAVALLGARTLARNPDFRDHVALWEAEVRSEPGNTRAWIFLSGAYRQRARWDDAERALLEAARLDPGSPEVWQNLGELRQALGRPGPARDAFRRAMDTGFVGDEILAGFVAASLELGRPGDALETLARLGGPITEGGMYWHLTGLARAAAGDREGALAALRTALSLPGHPPQAADALRELESAP